MSEGGGGNILPNLTNSQEPEPHVFGPLVPEPFGKKVRGLSPAEKKGKIPPMISTDFFATRMSGVSLSFSIFTSLISP